MMQAPSFLTGTTAHLMVTRSSLGLQDENRRFPHGRDLLRPVQVAAQVADLEAGGPELQLLSPRLRARSICSARDLWAPYPHRLIVA